MQQGFWSVALQFGLVIYFMANGLAVIMGGWGMAGRLNQWIGRTLWRAFCQSVGWALRSLANLFDGRGR
jgi:hypothetical protein